jgi:glycosyltransferase involved in cell wall biosynthesis
MKYQNPKISLIIPIYNGERYVAKCLDSIAHQSFSEFECIVADDGSTDDTLKIINTFDDPRIKIIKNNHKGSSFARNSGFTKARGDFIIFLDSDDFFHEDMLKTMYQQITEQSADVVICNYKRFDTVTKEYSEEVLAGQDAPSGVFNANDIPELIFNIFSGVPWNKLYRKDFLIKNNLTFAEDLVIGADSVFVHESLLFAEKIIYIDQSLISYRVNNPGSDVARARAYISDIALAIDKLHGIIKGYKNHKKFLQSLDNWTMGKCIWIYELDEHRVGSILKDIIKKYELAQYTENYYYSRSDIYEKILREAMTNRKDL